MNGHDAVRLQPVLARRRGTHNRISIDRDVTIYRELPIYLCGIGRGFITKSCNQLKLKVVKLYSRLISAIET